MTWLAAAGILLAGIAIGAGALTVYIVLKFKSWY